jgi:hypothetical protein
MSLLYNLLRGVVGVVVVGRLLTACSSEAPTTTAPSSTDTEETAPTDTSMPMQQKQLEGEVERDNRAKCGQITCPATPSPSPSSTASPTL